MRRPSWTVRFCLTHGRWPRVHRELFAIIEEQVERALAEMAA